MYGGCLAYIEQTPHFSLKFHNGKKVWFETRHIQFQRYAGYSIYTTESINTLSAIANTHSTAAYLLHGDSVLSSREDSVVTGEGLGASLQLGDVQAVVDALLVHEVREEVVQVAVKVLDLGVGHERVDGGVAVGALVKRPRGVGDGRRRDRGAGRRDGARAADGRQPHHDLVRVGAARGGGEPEVVGDVGNDVGAGVAKNGEGLATNILPSWKKKGIK